MRQRCWEATGINNEIALAYIAPLFFGISFIYSSVGFGGGSSYVAILVLLGIRATRDEENSIDCNSNWSYIRCSRRARWHRRRDMALPNAHTYWNGRSKTRRGNF